MKKISKNELEELIDLFARINTDLQKYSHVSHLIPKRITNGIDKYTDELIEESDRRQDEF